MNLPVDTVVPLALIVSELFTNALKHAHVDGRPARIAVVQRRLPQGGAVIEVADDGPGKAADAMPGFGTSLIQALARQINAELRESSDATRHPRDDRGSSSERRRGQDRLAAA